MTYDGIPQKPRVIGEVTNEETAKLFCASTEILEDLKNAEVALTRTPSFNPWDLGPCRMLVKIRQTIAKVEEKQK